ncbi:MAG: hypothetical protein NUW37_16725 [Planctomycetes bacterium]|nr:hypothetical protein [Planctomycetota bacterium]
MRHLITLLSTAASLLISALACTGGGGADSLVPLTTGGGSVTTDTTAPGAITNLAAVLGMATGEVNVTFTAPGDDEASGTASGYVVKLSQAQITSGTFTSATTFAQSWVPIASGSAESRTITGLSSGLVFIAIKSFDEVSNTSTVSNVVSITVPGTSATDTQAPSAITDLIAAAGANPGEANLTWTAPGDDGTTGAATTYEVRHSASAITPANFSSATLYTQTWTPSAAGATEMRTLTGLPAGTLFFAIIASDEVPNAAAAASNSPSCTVNPDSTPPAAITDLVAQKGTVTDGDIILTFTAPGDDGSTGTATSYEIRYATGPITAGNWSSATLYSQTWTPSAGGVAENFTIAAMTIGVNYYFAIKASDEVPNQGAISNSAGPVTAKGRAWYYEPAEPIYGIYGFSATDVYFVGTQGTVWHYDGFSYTQVRHYSQTQAAWDLYGVWGSSASDIWVCGDSATLWHYNSVSGTWTVDNTVNTINSNIQFRAIWGSSASDVYAVGQQMSGSTPQQAEIYHYNGTTWSRVATTGANALTFLDTTSTNKVWVDSVWGTGANDVFISGRDWNDVATSEEAFIVHFDGTTWSGNQLAGHNPPGSGSHRVYAGISFSATQGYAVGEKDCFYEYDGTTWTSQATGQFRSGESTTSIWRSIWGFSAENKVFFGSQDGWIGIADTSVQPVTTFTSADVADMSALGTGPYTQLDGAENPGDTDAKSEIWALWGTGYASGTCFAGGTWWDDGYTDQDSGFIASFDGTSWTPQQGLRGNLELYDVYGPSNTDIWAVGGDRYPSATNTETWVSHYDGTSWTNFDLYPLTSNSANFDPKGVWSTAAGNVYVVGKDRSGAGGGVVAVHATGTVFTTGWSVSHTSTTEIFNAVWGSSANDVYVAADSGVIWHYNGTAWSQVIFTGGAATTIGTNNFNNIWGIGANDVVAVADNGVIARWNGTAWTATTVSVDDGTGTPLAATGLHLYGVYYDTSTRIHICGIRTWIIWDGGTGWTEPMGAGTLGAASTATTLSDIWEEASSVTPQTMYVVGPGGAMYSWDGVSTFQTLQVTTRDVRAVHGFTNGSTAEAILVGTKGIIIWYK